MGYGGKQASRSGDVRRFNFTGNGSNTAFDLGFTPATQNQLIVTINGLVQHYDAFSVTGSTLTFTGTPAAGDAIQVVAVVDAVGVAGIPAGAIANVSSLAVSGAATFANTTTHTGLATFDSNVGVGTSSPAGLVGAGKTLAVYNNSHATITIQAADVTNDRNATLELLSSGNGGSLAQIIYGDTDTTPGTTSPLVIAGYHNGTRTERMRVSANGVVTTPYQPWFSAHRNSIVSYTDGQTVIWNQTLSGCNVGNCYNTTTGRFTAPVDGVYLFRADFRQSGNGAGYFDIRSSTGQVTRHEENSSYPNGYHQTLACMYKLAAGDYVWTQAGGSTVITPDANSTDRFEGYLLG